MDPFFGFKKKKIKNKSLSLSSPVDSSQSASPMSPQDESAAAATSPTSQSCQSPTSKSFYPRQGATSKYLIGWRKPGGTVNSVDFGNTRK